MLTNSIIELSNRVHSITALTNSIILLTNSVIALTEIIIVPNHIVIVLIGGKRRGRGRDKEASIRRRDSPLYPLLIVF